MRNEFHGELDALVDLLLRTGDTVVEMLERAVTSLVHGRVELADEVIRTDDRVDQVYADVQNRIVRLMALQAPVASDLRLTTALIHINIHLERMGDYALNVARMGKRSAQYEEAQDLVDQLEEMGARAQDVARAALRAFAHRDVDAARRLDDIDDAVDRLNISIFHRLLHLAAKDDSHLEWATHMVLVGRQIERYGDHAVDIGEATIFAVTGETVELSSNAPEDTPSTS